MPRHRAGRAAPLAQAIWPVIERLPHLRTVILVGAIEDDKAAFPGRDVHLFEDVIAAADAMRRSPPTRVSDEVAFWLYTSGSTGDPKGVKHVHSNLMATAKLFGQGVLGIGARRRGAFGGEIVLRLRARQRHDVSAVGRRHRCAVAASGRRRTACSRSCGKHRPSIFYGVPSLYTALLAHPEIGKGVGSDRLRLCVSAGEALPAHIGERWREVVGVDVLDGIGSTELLQTFLSNRPGDIRYGSTGKPVPGYEARIVDEKGRELGRRRDRRIDRARAVGRRRLLEPARQEPPHLLPANGPIPATNIRRDADGYYYYCGRTDDMFKVSGMWVSPFDVEAALTSHEAVLEAAVIGKQDADGLIKPKAFIVLKNGYVADDGLLEKLKLHVKETAGAWKYPRWIDVRTDLPRTATGKIQRFKLRDEDMRTARSD